MALIKWWNKETRNANGEFLRKYDWGVSLPDDYKNLKNNFTKIAPPVSCLLSHIECDWDEVNKEWIIDSATEKLYNDKQTAIQAFFDSPFNNITLVQTNNYIDSNVTDLNSAKETMKKMAEFTIGLREILREKINGE